MPILQATNRPIKDVLPFILWLLPVTRLVAHVPIRFIVGGQWAANGNSAHRSFRQDDRRGSKVGSPCAQLESPIRPEQRTLSAGPGRSERCQTDSCTAAIVASFDHLVGA